MLSITVSLIARPASNAPLFATPAQLTEEAPASPQLRDREPARPELIPLPASAWIESMDAYYRRTF
jgi:hypothetical protein